MRITKTTRASKPEELFWIVEGKISGEYVGLLEEACRGLLPDERAALCLNLENVSYVDRKGAQVLLLLERQGVLLEMPSLFVQELLNRYRQKS